MRRKPSRSTKETGTQDKTTDEFYLCRYLSEHSPVPLLAVEGVTHLVRYVNPAFCHLAGKERDTLLNKPFALVVPESEENECLAVLTNVYRTGAAQSLADQEQRYTSSEPNSSFETRYWSYAAWPLHDANEHRTGVMIQVTDTTEAALFRRRVTMMNQELLLSNVHQHELREEAETLNTQLQALATTDGLTGLYNHRTFQELLREEVERTRRYNAPLSLLLLDVDHFKPYNDTSTLR